PSLIQPERASEMAWHVDLLFYYVTLVTTAVFIAVCLALTYFCCRYVRRGPGERTPRILGSHRLEILWSVTPLLFFLSFFGWGAWVYDQALYPASDAEVVFLV